MIPAQLGEMPVGRAEIGPQGMPKAFDTVMTSVIELRDRWLTGADEAGCAVERSEARKACSRGIPEPVTADVANRGTVRWRCRPSGASMLCAAPMRLPATSCASADACTCRPLCLTSRSTAASIPQESGEGDHSRACMLCNHIYQAAAAR